MGQKGGCFCNGYNDVIFLCNRTDRHEIRAENVNRCRLVSSLIASTVRLMTEICMV